MSKCQLCASAVVLSLVCAAHADTFECDLPGLLGTYGSVDYRTETFDLGVEFASVDSVAMRISGTFDGGLQWIWECDWEGNVIPGEGDYYPRALGLFSVVRASDDQSIGTVSWDLDDGAFVDALDVEHVTAFESDHLTEGTGRASLQLNEYFNVFCPGYTIEEPSATITAAALILEGTPVPAPAALPMLAAGALVLLRRRRR